MKLKHNTNENGNPKIGETLVSDDIFTDDSAPVITPSGNICLDVGETEKLTADKNVAWSTSNDTIVTVDENGNIKGIKEGTATITATDKETGKTATVTVTVGKAILALSKDNGTTWTNYVTLADAVSAAGETNSIIKVLEDTELSFAKTENGEITGAVTIAENQNITLDLNGKQVTNTEIYSLLVNGGQLTIKDSGENGSITSTNDSQQSLISASSDNSKIIVESGNLIKSTDEDSTAQCRVINASNLEIKGGTITATGGMNIGITGKNIVINGGTITAKHAAISSSGNVEINNGTITSTGYYNNGYSNVVISSKSSTNGSSDVTINGGTITAPSGYYATVYMNGNSGNITVNGGYICGAFNGVTAIYQKNSSEGNISINGGKIEGWNSAIYQEKGNNILINYSGKNNTEIIQSCSGDYLATSAAIKKDNDGQITIGTNNDTQTYTDELSITYHNNGIVAENADIVIFNGCIEGSTGATAGESCSIGSANSITINQRSGYIVNDTIENDSTTNKQYVIDSIKYEASN